MSFWERDHKKCLERVGILQKHGKRLNVPSVSLAERFFSLPAESAGNSVRLPVGARGDTRRASWLNGEPQCFAVFNRTLT